jgi:hypothetical protein
MYLTNGAQDRNEDWAVLNKVMNRPHATIGKIYHEYVWDYKFIKMHPAPCSYFVYTAFIEANVK